MVADKKKFKRISQDTLEQISLEDLSVDLFYQRHFREERVRQLVAEFNPDAVGIITVSRRANGDNMVIDGGHRVEVCKRIADWEWMPALVIHNLSVAKEAYLFDLITTAWGSTRSSAGTPELSAWIQSY